MIKVRFSDLASSLLFHGSDGSDVPVKVGAVANRQRKSTLIVKKRILLTVTAALWVDKRRFYMGLPVKVKALS